MLDKIKKISWFEKAIMGSIIIILFLVLINSFNREFNHDEFEAVHTAWKIGQGEGIYFDFFQHHHPLFYFTLVPIVKIFGETTAVLFFSRAYVFLLMILSFWGVYSLGKKIHNKKTGLLAVFLLVSNFTFVDKGIEIRPDLAQSVAGIFAVYFLFKYFDQKKKWQLILSSLLFFVSFLFLQKAVFLIFLIGLVLLFLYWKKKFSMKDLFFFAGAFLIPTLLFFLIFLFFGNFREYYLFNWTINSKFLNYFTPFEYLWESLWQNWAFWLLYFSGILFLKKNQSLKILSFLSFGLLIFVFALRSPFAQYYVILIPYAAILAGFSLQRLFSEKIILFLMIPVLILPVILMVKDFENNSEDQLNKINYVLSNTEKSDFVYDGDIRFNLFRKDINFFWFSLRPEKGGLDTYRLINPSYEYDVYSDIQEKKPKVISKSWLDMKNKVISDNYQKSPKYSSLYFRKD